MTATLHQFPLKPGAGAGAGADAAWARYQALAVKIIDEPQLLIDRAFRERLLAAELAWKDSFIDQARTG